MLVFATSDKGGTGRSVTSCNIVYRHALQGGNVAYLDFDFGSPTSGAIFNISDVVRGTTKGGLHRFLLGEIAEPTRLEVWGQSERSSLRVRPDGAGSMTLFPGDENGGEFAGNPDIVARCVSLFSRLEEEYDLTLVDLSAGRSYATDIVLSATADPALANVVSRWLIFHRWTRQHVFAAAGLAYGLKGIIESGVQRGHDRDKLTDTIRFVRTAVVDPRSQELSGLRPSQVAWLNDVNDDLRELAGQERIGRMMMLGSVPIDPVLQWREQLISDADTITRQIANPATVDAFVTLAKRLTDEWPEL